MHAIPPQILALIGGMALATVVAAVAISFGPRVVGLLILKYLRRRRIAWVSLIAVMLCTTMVLVVISVMGGWLDMFESNARGLTGDLVVRGTSLAGFSGYEKMIQRVEKLPTVAAAVPSLETFGLLNIGGMKSTPARVMGIPIEQIGRVNNFPESLYRQHVGLLDRLDAIAAEKKKLAKASGPSADRKAETLASLNREADELNEKLKRPPTFTPPDPIRIGVGQLPDKVKFLDEGNGVLDTGDPQLNEKVHFERYGPPGSRSGFLVTHTPISDAEADRLRGMGDEEKPWDRAVTELARESHWPGMICSTGVLEIRKDREGKTVGRFDFKYTLIATLTVLGVSPNGRIDPNNRADTSYRIVDDSHTKYWQYDSETVYVPFDRLQSDLGMAASQATDSVTGQKFTEPARTSEIHIRLKEGVDIMAARSQVQTVVDQVVQEERAEREARGDAAAVVSPVRVETWREAGETFIDAIEHEKVLVVVLFGIISVVAIFLIFCIFYMIVAEKTRDIGIIKSVGATSGQVAGIFLGYGLAIGLVGAGLGLATSFLIVHNINELHAWMGRALKVQIWSPQVYAFDTIPNTMEPKATAIIVVVAVLSSVLGALIPAARAARLNPVESLRWE